MPYLEDAWSRHGCGKGPSCDSCNLEKNLVERARLVKIVAQRLGDAFAMQEF